MDFREDFENCIQEYLGKYSLELNNFEKIKQNTIIGDLKLYKIEGRQETNMGHLHYIIDKDIKDLYISCVIIPSKNKPTLPVKLFKIFLLYLLSLRNYLKTVTLSATPGGMGKVGTEFCLLCFYQQLGFDPIDYDSRKMLDECLKQLEKVNPNCYTQPSLCILCECQKWKIPFSNVNLEYLRVDMKALVPNMKEALKDAYEEIGS